MNKNTEFIREADMLQSEANEVLRESGIAKTFSALGDVKFVGGYRLQLLGRPDIDMIVTTDSLQRDAAVEVTKKLLDQGYFQSVVFIDHFSFKKRLDAEMSSDGFYWCLDVPKFNFGRQWKCDVWYIHNDANHYTAHARRFEAFLEKNPLARETILKLKSAFRQGKGYRANANGVRICEAVLEHGITKPDSLAEYLTKKTDT
jgi:hypothetical protein